MSESTACPACKLVSATAVRTFYPNQDHNAEKNVDGKLRSPDTAPCFFYVDVGAHASFYIMPKFYRLSNDTLTINRRLEAVCGFFRPCVCGGENLTAALLGQVSPLMKK